jgi:site-specific DNA-adenine methylase
MDLNSYDGGKGLVFRTIINEIPPHDIFISGFAGACAVARNKRPAKLNILIDADERVIDGWRSMLVNSDEVSGDIAGNDEAAVSSTTSPEMMRGAAIVKSDEAITSSELTRYARAGDRLIRIDAAAATSELMRLASITESDEATRWILVHGDFLEVLPYLPVTRRTVMYLDPPYLMETRSSQRPLYRHEFGSQEEHEELLTAVSRLNCRALLSGYQSELYGRLLADWRRLDYWTVNRAGTRVCESLWLNYDEPLRLHDYRWLGDGWRERDRIKQKAKRWVNRFDSLPVLERRFILQALDEVGLLD